MGLHTGQAIATDGRYTGLSVHRAARIGAAGHGGQILVSQATQTLLEDEEEDLHIFLRDLGEQRLKDLDRPVRLYQASADGLLPDFPPVRGLAPEPATAAIRPTSFWRSPLTLAALAVLVLGVAVAGYLGTRDTGGGLGAVSPNHVGVIDSATNRIVAEVPVGIEPGPIAAGAGEVWVGNVQDRNLTRVDAAARTVTGTVPLDNRTPTGIAVGLGAVWVAHGLRGQVSRVEPQFGQVARTVDVAETAFGSPLGSVALGASTVWVAFGDSTLARLDGAGRILGETLAGSQPAGVVVDGASVWMTSSGDSTVLRFNTRTFEEGPIRPFNVGARPTGIASVDGYIWIANSDDDSVTRIEPDSGATLPIAVGDEPAAIAGSPGTLWVANAGDSTVSRIDTGSNEVVETIEIGSVPAGLAVVDGFVWVTAQEEREEG
jgi:YVTN family beta-propeller protein